MWRRLLKEFQNIVENFKDPMRFQSEKILFDFSKAEDANCLSTFSDASFGGYSTVCLRRNANDGCVTFSGSCTKEVKEYTRLKRSGFCGIRSNSDDGEFMDVSEFDQLVMKIRGTRLDFLANIRVYNLITDSESNDVWQAFFTCRGGDWHTVQIPFRAFVLTWRGRIVPEVTEMNSTKVMSVGITMSLPASVKENVDFYLDVAWIKATVGYLD